MIGDAIFQRLNGFAGLSALVSGRIYPARPPQNATRPYVVYHEQAPIDLAPEINESGDLVQSRFQIDAWAETASAAKAVGQQVRLALRDFSGTAAGVRIDDIRAEGGFDDFDEEVTPVLFRRSQDFTVQYGE